MRVITRQCSQEIEAETKPRRVQSCEHFTRVRRIYEFLYVHSNPIWKGRNCRDYRPSHLTFREYLRPFWFSRSCVVVAYCNRACAVQIYKALSVWCQRCMKKKNKKKITLRCMVIGKCAVEFLHYIPLYRNTQHCATLNCSVKTRLRVGGT